MHDSGPYAIRFGSIFVGAFAVYLTYVLGMLLLENRRPALAAAGVHAFVPGFDVLVSAISNDTMAILFSTLAVVAMTAWLRSDAVLPRGPVLLAVCATALALLSKLTAVILVPLFLWVLAKKRRVRYPLVVAAALGAAGIGGFAATYRLVLHHLGWPLVDDLYVWLFYAPHAELTALAHKLGLFYSIRWGSPAPSKYAVIGPLSTATLDVIAIVGAVGFSLLYRGSARRREVLGLIPVGLLVAIIVVLRTQLSSAFPVQARFFYPVLSLFSVMVAAGIEHLLPPRRKHWIGCLPILVYAAGVLSVHRLEPILGALRVVPG
jgi:hypothetical protein